MSAVTDTTQFRHGAGRLCLDFTRTLRLRGTPQAEEELAGPEALRDWVRQFGPAFEPGRSDVAWISGRGGAGPAAGPVIVSAAAHGQAVERSPLLDPPSMARVRQAQRLREAVFELIAATRGTDGPGGCPAPARELINRASAAATPAPSLDAAGRLRWQAADPVSATLALVARDVLDLVSSPAADRIRGCGNPACGALFFDGSRPGSRRWCSMHTCGNLAKKGALRSKATTS